ncbi:hypothetical protein TNCV_473681 [Trichonephila clavipes]|nr:hypothetical protein TNCV_473681 [Trichonephila clavipes]
MNEVRKLPAGFDCLTVSSEDFTAVDAYKSTVNSVRATVQHYNHSSNASTELDRKETSLFCITTMQDRIALRPNTGRYVKTDIHTCSTSSLKPIFGSVGYLIVHKIEGNVTRSTCFNERRSSGSRVQMDTHLTRIFLHGHTEGRNE